MKVSLPLRIALFFLLSIPAWSQYNVTSVNGHVGALTFIGSGISCNWPTLTCTFSGASGASMTWPAAAGIANYAGSSVWGTSYSASNPLPASIGGTGTTSLSGVRYGNSGSADTVATSHGLSLPANCAQSNTSTTAYTCATSPTFTPAAGDHIQFEALYANTTTSPTLAVDGAAAAPIIAKSRASGILAAGDLTSTHWLSMTFDGTNWQVEGQLGNSAATGACTAGQFESADTTAGPTCAAVQYSQLGGTVPTWNQSTTGNAATASALSSTGASYTKYGTNGGGSQAYIYGVPGIDVVDYPGINCNGQFDGTASMTSGSAVLTITSGAFSSSMVGYPIAVVAAGAADTYNISGYADLITTISAFTDSNHVTLAAAAGHTVSGVYWIAGQDNTTALNALYASLPTKSFDTPNGWMTGHVGQLYFPPSVCVMSGTLTLGGTSGSSADHIDIHGSGRAYQDTNLGSGGGGTILASLGTTGVLTVNYNTTTSYGCCSTISADLMDFIQVGPLGHANRIVDLRGVMNGKWAFIGAINDPTFSGINAGDGYCLDLNMGGIGNTFSLKDSDVGGCGGTNTTGSGRYVLEYGGNHTDLEDVHISGNGGCANAIEVTNVGARSKIDLLHLFRFSASSCIPTLFYFDTVSGSNNRTLLQIDRLSIEQFASTNLTKAFQRASTNAYLKIDDVFDTSTSNTDFFSGNRSWISAPGCDGNTPNCSIPGWAITQPSLPAGTGSTNKLQNTTPFPVTIYQAGESGTHIIDTSGNDTALPADPPFFTIYPNDYVYYATTLPTSWKWYGQPIP